MAFPTEDILEFWFKDSRDDPEAAAKRHRFWFQGGTALDAIILDRYATLIPEAAEFSQTLINQHDQSSALDLLAIIIALDQFPRHVFRGTSRVFSYTTEAERVCRHLISKPGWNKLSPIEKIFSLTPFHHAEDSALQTRAIQLIGAMQDSENGVWQPVLKRFLHSFQDHALIVERFGRFPHRNPLLNRAATEEELLYLKERPQYFGQSFTPQTEE